MDIRSLVIWAVAAVVFGVAVGTAPVLVRGFLSGALKGARIRGDYLTWFLGALLVALVTAFVASIPLRNKADYQAVVTIWAGLGTTAIAILTAGYVLTTSRQLGAMRDQLAEMEKTREMMGRQLTEMETSRYLLVQPLPYMSELACAVWVPTLPNPSAADPLNLKPDIGVFIHGDLKNLGNGPALQMETYVELVYRSESSGDVAKRSTPARTGFLASGEHVSVEEQFEEVEAGDLLDNVLSTKSQEAPRARVISLYRNATGGCFKATYEFALHFYSEDKERLKEWASVVRTVGTRYSNEIAAYEAQRNLGTERRIKAWIALRRAFRHDVGERPDFEGLDVAASALASRTKLEMLSEISYLQALVSTATEDASVKWPHKPEKAAEAPAIDTEDLPFE
jgi:hypothetical protein